MGKLFDIDASAKAKNEYSYTSNPPSASTYCTRTTFPFRRMKYEYVHFVRIISYGELNPETEKNTHFAKGKVAGKCEKKWARNYAV